MRRRRIAGLAAATALLSALVTVPTAEAASGPLRYVALGDSYAAGSGIVPPDPTASPLCLRSLLNYGHLIAAATRAQYTDATCGGADTTHFTTSQYPGVPPQLDMVQRDTQVVTVTIGGNDSSVFINSIVQCGTAGLSTGGTGSPCKDQNGSAFEDTIRSTTYPALVQTLQALKAKAPRAKIAITGYPWIMPETGGCFPSMPIATGDVPYLRSLQATLNDAVKRAAAATRTTYVDMNVVSDGRDACQPIGVRWIEPVLGGTNPVVVHPNALGGEGMALQTRKALRLR